MSALLNSDINIPNAFKFVNWSVGLTLKGQCQGANPSLYTVIHL